MPATLALLVVASATLFTPQSSPTRTEEPLAGPALATGLHADLETAIAELATEEVRWNRLALRYGDGDHAALEKLYAEALDQLPREVVREFDAEHGIAARTIYEMLVTWKADELFRRLLERAARAGRPLAPDDLLAVLWSPELTTLPRDRAPRAVLDYVDLVAARTSREVSVRLWYPSVAFLVFAALNARDGSGPQARPLTRGWWPDDAAGRARRSAFITSLLELVVEGDDPKLMTSIVDAALAPPLDVPHARGLVTCCRAEFARHRGRVGFDRSHLEFVSRHGADLQRSGVAPTPFMPAPPTVAGFMAMMRLRILLELDPRALDGPAALRLGTAAEVEAWYRAMFAERGWRNFWAEAGDDVAKMVAGTFPDLRDARIDALAARLADPTLSDDEQQQIAAELRDLEQARDRDHEHLAGVILGLLASAGDAGFVKDELLRLQPKTPCGDWNATLVLPWLTLLERDPGWVDEVVDDQLRGRRDVPVPALECALLDLRRRLSQEVRARDVEMLVELGTKGPAAVRGSAFVDQALLPSEAARRLYDAAFADAAAPPGDPRDATGRRLFRPMVELLFERRSEPWVHAALLETFDPGSRQGGDPGSRQGGDPGSRQGGDHDGTSLWRGDYFHELPPEGPLAQQQARRARELLEWLATELSDDEFQRLASAQRIPKRILEARAAITPSGR